ncbi:MAG: AarF/ABC1/UbiB kinase family protein [Spirochaetia bacterium]|nr:AarF/ABC1/UbiB kinase family protein [Spirochaetia bacterium]
MSDSIFDRVWKLGGAAGRIAFSLAGAAGDAAINATKLASLTKAVQSLAELKGAPMKLGQMLSLQEGMFPPEVQKAFAQLRKDADPIPFDQVREIIRNELGEKSEQLLEIEEKPLGSASLGQVHAARLSDGTEVVVKVQYPDMRRALGTDLAVLRTILGALSPIMNVPMGPVLKEIRTRLLEEIDYAHEAENVRRMREQFADLDWLLMPEVVSELSTDRLITLTRLRGLTHQEATAQEQSMRDIWGKRLLEFMVRSVFQKHVLHADPNAANLAFAPDGKIIVYDFGCIKHVPESIAANYFAIVRDVLANRTETIPDHLKRAGIHLKNGNPVSHTFLESILVFHQDTFPDRELGFAESPDVYTRLWEIGSRDFFESRNIVFPPDILFIHRTFGGHFGNLRGLAPRANWHQFLASLLREIAHIAPGNFAQDA